MKGKEIDRIVYDDLGDCDSTGSDPIVIRHGPYASAFTDPEADLRAAVEFMRADLLGELTELQQRAEVEAEKKWKRTHGRRPRKQDPRASRKGWRRPGRGGKPWER